MRLISKQRDYYDHFAKNRELSDLSYTWNRKEETIYNIDFSLPRAVIDRQYPHTLIAFLVWFCGRPIPVLYSAGYNLTKHLYYPIKSREVYYYSYDELSEEVLNSLAERRGYGFLNISKQFLKQFFDIATDPVNIQILDSNKISTGAIPIHISYEDIHRRYNTPVFMHEIYSFRSSTYDTSIVLNPVLANIDFIKAIDPFSAFQELEMFLANQLAPRDTRMDRPIPDKLKAQSHGFNELSFRKDKQA